MAYRESRGERREKERERERERESFLAIDKDTYRQREEMVAY